MRALRSRGVGRPDPADPAADLTADPADPAADPAADRADLAADLSADPADRADPAADRADLAADPADLAADLADPAADRGRRSGLSRRGLGRASGVGPLDALGRTGGHLARLASRGLHGAGRGLRRVRGRVVWPIVAVLVVIVAVAAPLVVKLFGVSGPMVSDASSLNLFGDPTGPSSVHPLGVDAAGRDELARLLYALRSMVVVVFAGSALAVAAGWAVAVLGRIDVDWSRLGVDRLQPPRVSLPRPRRPQVGAPVSGPGPGPRDRGDPQSPLASERVSEPEPAPAPEPTPERHGPEPPGSERSSGRPQRARAAWKRPAWTRPAWTRPGSTRPAWTRPAWTRPAWTQPGTEIRLTWSWAWLGRWLAALPVCVGNGILAFPATLLALAVGAGMSPGIWRLILATGLVLFPHAAGAMAAEPAGETRRSPPDSPQPDSPRSDSPQPDHAEPDHAEPDSPQRPRRQLRSAGLRAHAWRAVTVGVGLLSGAVVLYGALTFLGDGQGAREPQLGGMLAQAGSAILTGVPEWWGLVFPGLVLLLAALCFRALAGTLPGAAEVQRAPVLGRRLLAGGRLGGWMADRVAITLTSAVVVILLGHLIAGGSLKLGASGAQVGASVSLLVGGAVIWLLLTGLGVALALRLPTRALRIPVAVTATAPTAWLALGSLYLFSDSIGKLPLLRGGAGAYVSIGHNAGDWLGALLMPWLVLGATQVAVLAPQIAATLRAERESPRHRVAAAAGVSAAQLRSDDGRAVLGTLLAPHSLGLPRFLAAAVVVEVAYRIPGVGARAVTGFLAGHVAPVTGIAVAAAMAVLGIALIAEIGRAIIDPGVHSR